MHSEKLTHPLHNKTYIHTENDSLYLKYTLSVSREMDKIMFLYINTHTPHAN
jgi:hypothetical protein